MRNWERTGMKSLRLLCLLLVCCGSICGQDVPPWYRVYTFDESRIEMNTSKVVLGGDIGRLTFRWIFDLPQPFSGDSQLKYKTREETIEFRCSENLYRVFQINFLDSGRVLRSEVMRPPYQWHRYGSVMATIAIPACELINRELELFLTKTKFDDEQAELDKASNFARSFLMSLNQSRDFKPVIRKFFVPNYLSGYLQDRETNWFLNLNRDTATKASRAELERYYVAILNAAYLSSLYLISQSQPSEETTTAAEASLVPEDVIQFVKSHPYSVTYKRGPLNYDYLAERIDSLPRMRSYTDLMEKVATLMQTHVTRVNAEKSDGYRELLEKWVPDERVRTCQTRCLGLPKGSRLFEISVPIFRLQIAEIMGQLKVVSVLDNSTEPNH